MTYAELNFLVFLSVTIFLFYLVPARRRWIVLLVMSLIFYGFAGPAGYVWIFVTSFSVWIGARRMGQYYAASAELLEQAADRKEKKAIKQAAKNRCRRVLIALLILNIGILCVFKYTRFLEQPLNALLRMAGGNGGFSAAVLILPLGISYYTFSAIGYVLDVYWQRVECEKSYARFLLFELYFLHILQGPIERYGSLGQRLRGEFRFDYDRACRGIQLMIWGFFKKLVIADRLNMFIEGVYGDAAGAPGALCWIAILFDVVYIYADFSGCMDIARGASGIFGIEMDLNFDHPFSARSVVEFWRKWHMSLGGWFRDYVYYPVSTAKAVKNISRYAAKKQLSRSASRGLMTVLPVFVTWILTGLWHGTGLPYLAWGVYYACWIFLAVVFGEQAHELAVRAGINTEAWSWKCFQMIRTTLIFAGGRLLSRPGTLRTSGQILNRALFHFQPWTIFDGTLFQYGLGSREFCVALVSIAVFGCVSSLQMKMPLRETLAKQNLAFRWGVILAALLVILVFGIYGTGYDAASFVYMEY